MIKNLLWLPFIPASIVYSTAHSKLIHYICLATGIIMWTSCCLILVAIFVHASHARRRT